MKVARRHHLAPLGAGLAVAIRLSLPVAAHAAAPVGVGASVTLDRFMDDRPAADPAANDARIAKMRRLIQVTPDDDPQKPDFFRLLAGLYADKYRTTNDRVRALADSIPMRPAIERPSLEAQQREHDRNAQRWLLEAVKAYIGATKFRRYERLDEVLFRLGGLLAAAGKHDQSREFFLRLRRDTPTSKYVAAAELAVTDGECRSGDVEEAAARYDRVAERDDATIRSFAEYRKGWCYLDRGRHQQALESFVAAVRMTADGKSPSGAPWARLLRAGAVTDLVRAYARTGGPDRAWDFFRKVDADAAPDMMTRLIDCYRAAGRSGDADRAAELARGYGVDVGRR